nr:putative GH32 family protein [Micropterna sequax]
MKKIVKSVSYLIMAAILAGCSPGDIAIDDFESGTFDKWAVEGDAFGAKPAQGAYPGQQEVKGWEGKYLANSYNGGDDARGTLTSAPFTIERDCINFLIGGGMHDSLYIELIVDGKNVCTSRSLAESETLEWESWNVKAYKDKKAVIRIVDNQQGGWGHILVDEIAMSNQSKSKIEKDYRLSLRIDKKYLLVPIEDKGTISHLHLEAEGKVVSPQLDIRVAQSKIDYWMPIDVEQYKGKELTLLFDQLAKDNIGYSQIKQSDDYHFDYNEKYRPHYHFTPKYGWMNDPNGMVYVDGEYHLFYQYNPYGSAWGNMNWGHTVSKDLKKWEHLPVAISPDSLGAIFSGSAIIDKDNTAGFGKGAMVVIYTSAGKVQTQSIAYSTDKGRTFHKYDHNPVLSDANHVDFRDPKVAWHEATKQWIMTLATGQTITFYASPNLKEWTKLSDFGTGIGGHGGVWECPDLFPMTYNGQTKWVLFVSINPGGPNGGSATQYFIGGFDGKTFKADNLPYPLWLDYGRDNYAGITWSNAPENRHIFIGWMSNWQYAQDVPTINFRSAMTVPRELKLAHNGKHLIVANPPVKEIYDLRSETKEVQDLLVEKTSTIDKLLDNNHGAYEIEMTVQLNKASAFDFKLINKKGEEMSFVFDVQNGNLAVDRSKSGAIDFSKDFAANGSKAPLTKKGEYKIRLLVDKASTELFVDNGELVQTNTIFPSEPLNTLQLNSQGGAIRVKDIKIYNLK